MSFVLHNFTNPTIQTFNGIEYEKQQQRKEDEMIYAENLYYLHQDLIKYIQTHKEYFDNVGIYIGYNYNNKYKVRKMYN